MQLPNLSPSHTVVDSAFAEIQRLHRNRANVEELYLLPSLFFQLAERGNHYVLWRPIADFLRCGFPIDVLEYLCDGEITVASMDDDATEYAQRISAETEKIRRLHPKTMITSGREVLLNLASDLAKDLQISPAVSDKIDRMLRAYRVAIRNSAHRESRLFRAQLAELALDAHDDDIQSCVAILRRARDERAWPPNAAALASQTALAREWLDAEEDAAWSHL